MENELWKRNETSRGSQASRMDYEAEAEEEREFTELLALQREFLNNPGSQPTVRVTRKTPSHITTQDQPTEPNRKTREEEKGESMMKLEGRLEKMELNSNIPRVNQTHHNPNPNSTPSKPNTKPKSLFALRRAAARQTTTTTTTVEEDGMKIDPTTTPYQVPVTPDDDDSTKLKIPITGKKGHGHGDLPNHLPFTKGEESNFPRHPSLNLLDTLRRQYLPPPSSGPKTEETKISLLSRFEEITTGETTKEGLKAMKDQYFQRVPMESEKLKWMISDPNPDPDPDQNEGAGKSKSKSKSKPIRFDFQGHPIASQVELSTFQGLHHHGEEPDRPGYTIQELLLLIRSSMAGQRVVALTTLNKLLINLRHGEFSTELGYQLIHTLIESESPTSLIWNCQAKSTSVIFAAINVIHSWLRVPFLDPVTSEVISCQDYPTDLNLYHLGYRSTTLSYLTHSDLTEFQADDPSEMDKKVFGYDIIMGFLSLPFLPTLQILLTQHHQPQFQLLILQILRQVAQHSSWAATLLVDTPSLLETVYRTFIHLKDFTTTPPTSFTNLPEFVTTRAALQLLRTIIQASRRLTYDLVKQGYTVKLESYFHLGRGATLGYSPHELMLLQCEVLTCLQVVAGYGLYQRDPLPLVQPTLNEFVTTPTPDPFQTVLGTACLRFLESFILNNFNLPRPQIQSSIDSTQGLLTKLCHALHVDTLPSPYAKVNWSAMVDVITAAGILIKTGLADDTTLANLLESPLDQPRLTGLLRLTLQTLLGTLQDLAASSYPDDIVRGHWNGSFRRLFPSMTSPVGMAPIQTFCRRCLPDLGTLRSILELTRYSNFKLDHSDYTLTATLILQLLEFLGRFPPHLIHLLPPIQNLILSWVHLESPEGSEEFHLKFAVHWYLATYPDDTSHLNSSLLALFQLDSTQYDLIDTVSDDPGVVGFLTEYRRNLNLHDISYELLPLEPVESTTPTSRDVTAERRRIVACLTTSLRRYDYLATTDLSPSQLRTLTSRLHCDADKIQLLKVTSLPPTLLFDPTVTSLLTSLITALHRTESLLRHHHLYPTGHFPHRELSLTDRAPLFAYYLDIYRTAVTHYLDLGPHQTHSTIPLPLLPLLIAPLSMDLYPADFRVTLYATLLPALPSTQLHALPLPSPPLPHHYLHPLESSSPVLARQAELLLAPSATTTVQTTTALHQLLHHHLQPHLLHPTTSLLPAHLLPPLRQLLLPTITTTTNVITDTNSDTSSS